MARDGQDPHESFECFRCGHAYTERYGVQTVRGFFCHKCDKEMNSATHMRVSMGLGGGVLCYCRACRRVDDLRVFQFDYDYESRVAQQRGDFEAAARADDRSREIGEKIDGHLARCQRRALDG